MARLVVTHNITVDGSIEFLDSWFDPSPTGPDLSLLEARPFPGGRDPAPLRRALSALLVGRDRG